MALNGDILGAEINTIENSYNETDIADLSQARLEINKMKAWAIINHFKTNGVIAVPALGLTALPGGGPVTGAANGTIH